MGWRWLSTWVALVVSSGFASLAPVQAAPRYGSKTITIPIYNTAGGQFTASPQIDVAFGTASGFSAANLFTLDTGSTGIAVSSPLWDPVAAGAQLLGSGNMTYSSSGRVLQGNWYQAILQVGSGAATAQTSVPVLFVTSIDCLIPSRDCQANPNPTGVSFFGVGFAREAGSQATGPSGTVASIPANNPLLNIYALNGSPVTASTPTQPGSTGVQGDFSSGYILTPAGLTLGLTAANTAGFSMLPLSWNDQTQASGFDSGYADWNPVPVTVSVNGSTGVGSVLTDTGIAYMIVSPEPGGLVLTDGSCPLAKNCLAANTSVDILINAFASYGFTIGPQDGAPLAPAPPAAPPFAVKADDTAVFVNTGYQFFNQFDYVFDHVNGQVGYATRASVPGPLPVAAAAVAFRWSRRLRHRLSRQQP